MSDQGTADNPSLKEVANAFPARCATVAECRAADAVKAAEEGRWRDALIQAELAWSLEFTTGRPLRHARPFAWQRLRDRIGAAYLAQEIADVCRA